MDVKTFLKTQGETVIVDVAEKAGTTVGYLRQIVYGHRRVSTSLAQRLVKASNGLLTLHELRPDIWVDPIATLRMSPAESAQLSP